MAFDVTAIREAVRAHIQLTIPKVQVHAHDVESGFYPRVIVLPASPYVTYHSSFGAGLAQVNLLVEVKAAAMDPESAQIQLGRFLGAGTGQDWSIFDAVERVTDGPTPNLAGEVENVTVSDVTVNSGNQLENGTVEFAATFQVSCLVRRS